MVNICFINNVGATTWEGPWVWAIGGPPAPVEDVALDDGGVGERPDLQLTRDVLPTHEGARGCIAHQQKARLRSPDVPPMGVLRW